MTADIWRSARANYFKSPPEQRAEINKRWNIWPGPRDPRYYAWAVTTVIFEFEIAAANSR